MQFVGIIVLVFGYAAAYTAGAMLKRPGDGAQSGSVLYWFTGIDALGAPSGGSNAPAKKKGASTPTGKGAPKSPSSHSALHRGSHG